MNVSQTTTTVDVHNQAFDELVSRHPRLAELEERIRQLEITTVSELHQAFDEILVHCAELPSVRDQVTCTCCLQKIADDMAEDSLG